MILLQTLCRGTNESLFEKLKLFKKGIKFIMKGRHFQLEATLRYCQLTKYQRQNVWQYFLLAINVLQNSVFKSPVYLKCCEYRYIRY